VGVSGFSIFCFFLTMRLAAASRDSEVKSTGTVAINDNAPWRKKIINENFIGSLSFYNS
jgi:hypothetical protein